jgi:hypothetical protein
LEVAEASEFLERAEPVPFIQAEDGGLKDGHDDENGEKDQGRSQEKRQKEKATRFLGHCHSRE